MEAWKEASERLYAKVSATLPNSKQKRSYGILSTLSLTNVGIAMIVSAFVCKYCAREISELCTFAKDKVQRWTYYLLVKDQMRQKFFPIEMVVPYPSSLIVATEICFMSSLERVDEFLKKNMFGKINQKCGENSFLVPLHLESHITAVSGNINVQSRVCQALLYKLSTRKRWLRDTSSTEFGYWRLKSRIVGHSELE